LGDKGGLLGDTAKRVPESATGLDFAHYVIRIEDAELDFGLGLDKRMTK